VPATSASGRREPDRAANFTDNLVRLLGLHALSQHLAAQLLDVSNTTMSSWITGKSTPSLIKAIAVADLFGISAERLISAPFTDLLVHELADPQRFERVEERLRPPQRPKRKG
jgi:DNA-binding XRE family transcriptional regulator